MNQSKNFYPTKQRALNIVLRKEYPVPGKYVIIVRQRSGWTDYDVDEPKSYIQRITENENKPVALVGKVQSDGRVQKPKTLL